MPGLQFPRLSQGCFQAVNFIGRNLLHLFNTLLLFVLPLPELFDLQLAFNQHRVELGQLLPLLRRFPQMVLQVGHWLQLQLSLSQFIQNLWFPPEPCFSVSNGFGLPGRLAAAGSSPPRPPEVQAQLV
ncbi:MAG: hypothetical protein IPM76_20640 [Chloroflexi bacterium]|nr:hypothetical protein [Chloroflexota bacterium]